MTAHPSPLPDSSVCRRPSFFHKQIVVVKTEAFLYPTSPSIEISKGAPSSFTFSRTFYYCPAISATNAAHNLPSSIIVGRRLCAATAAASPHCCLSRYHNYFYPFKQRHPLLFNQLLQQPLPIFVGHYRYRPLPQHYVDQRIICRSEDDLISSTHCQHLFHPPPASFPPTANFSPDQRMILCSRRDQALCYPVATAFIPTASQSSMPLLPPSQWLLDPRHSPFLPLPAAFHHRGSSTLSPIATLPSSSSYLSNPRSIEWQLPLGLTPLLKHSR
ncbi:hypothetical protein BHE74_00025809 [Ensete ventricosum]|nr:hypothetical protein BHE74_00025809 [Ensete ventricosum]